ncbi:MAG: carbon storage regulator [Oscillospiraceae bacterium]|nr:carbon storage regulator [Oscillospiraceae bacterium]
MLSLSIKSGEYITIGDNIVIQVFREGPDARVEVKAPRELTILRSEVYERSGKKPGGLFDKRPKSSSELVRNAKRADKMAQRKEFFDEQKQQEEQKKRAHTQELLSIAGQMERLAQTISDADTKRQWSALAVRLLDAADGE